VYSGEMDEVLDVKKMRYELNIWDGRIIIIVKNSKKNKDGDEKSY